MAAGQHRSPVQRIGHHDLGGNLEEFGKIDRTEKTLQEWELKTHSLVSLMSKKGVITVDELRRGLEDMTIEAYRNQSYYQKWAAAAAAIQMERGNISQAELDAAMGKAVQEPGVKFKTGDVVRVLREHAAVRWRRPHLRTPGYIFGVCGVIERECVGYAEHPEGLAFRQDIPRQPLYRVRFHQQAVWEGYAGEPHDTLDIEIYQPWLEPATQQQLDQQLQAAQQRGRDLAAAAQRAHGGEHGHSPGHAHHDHGHGQHAHDHGDHVHEARSVVEQAAIDKQGDDQQDRAVTDALAKVLQDKGIVSAAELRAAQESLDSLGRKQLGARVVARAWTEPDFKAHLLRDAVAALEEMGITSSNFPPRQLPPGYHVPEGAPTLQGTVLRAVENSNKIAILGASPSWYKSRSYRARAVREPRAVLEEFGTVLPEDVSIRVHDSTADCRYLVIPQRPAGTEGWSQEQLAQLVTRDSMIGTTTALSPDDVKACNSSCTSAV